LVILIILVGIVIVLSFSRKASETQTVLPVESKPGTSTEDHDRVTLPLALPGKGQEEGHVLPEPSKSPVKTTVAVSTSEQHLAPETLEPSNETALPKPIKTHRVSHKITKGDTLSKIFKGLGLSANLLHKIVHSSKSAKALTKIKPGEIIHVELNEQKDLVNLTLQHSKIKSLFIEATDNGGFNASNRTKDVELRTAHVQATIENSLYVSAKKAGLPDAEIMELANIFGWDIDFALEIRTGDRFTVIFQEEYLQGEKLRNGPILAAEFINQGRTYRAVRYEDATGSADYFTPEGRSMRKAFLRAPVDFRRISSRFTKERWHPVLGKKRPHRGVDYAAKTGTPIRAAGDGKIVHRGKKGGYGRTVIIQHGQRYTTLYGHLSRYNKKAKQGSKVKQGQTIGYVGQSGLATGPHLHYEFRVNGTHRNPLTVKLPAAEPIAKKYRADFILKTSTLTAQLDTLNRIVVADAR
jgi:murein DD-endopeptidase MepM/ murein hydrolase activator NlpD